MTTSTPILSLLLMVKLISGVNGFDLVAIQIPRLEFDGSRTPFYECRFIDEVQCWWKADGQRINITDHGYTWRTGNGSHTNDCSIEAKSTHRQDQNTIKLGDKVECGGLGYGPIQVNIDDSVELPCSIPDKDNCNWTRKQIRIEMGGHYTYTKDNDCSIRINRIQPIDLTYWICSNADPIRWEGAVYTLVQLNSTAATTRVTANSSNGTTTSIDRPNETVSKALIATGLTLLTATAIGVVCVIIKGSKAEITTDGDHHNCNGVGGEREVPATSVSNANYTFHNARATCTSRDQTEDDEGYLIATPRVINKKAKPTKNSQSYSETSNPESHVYETINDGYYSEVEDPTRNNLT